MTKLKAVLFAGVLTALLSAGAVPAHAQGTACPPGQSGNQPYCAPDRTAPKVTINSTVPFVRGRMRVTISCPANEVSCRVSGPLRARRSTLGRVAGTIAGGARKVIRVRPTGAARRALRRARRLRATIAVTATDVAGNRGTTTKRVTIRRRGR